MWSLWRRITTAACTGGCARARVPRSSARWGVLSCLSHSMLPNAACTTACAREPVKRRGSQKLPLKAPSLMLLPRMQSLNLLQRLMLLFCMQSLNYTNSHATLLRDASRAASTLRNACSRKRSPELRMKPESLLTCEAVAFVQVGQELFAGGSMHWGWGLKPIVAV